MQIKLLKITIAFIALLYNKFVSLLAYVSCFLILFMMLSIGASVLFRKTWLDFGWALEVSQFILIIITLFGAGWLMRSLGHTRVDILATYLHGKVKDLYNGLIFSLVSIICLCFFIIGFYATLEAYFNGTLIIESYLVFKKWILLSLFPIGGLILFIESTKLAINYFKSSRNNL